MKARVLFGVIGGIFVLLSIYVFPPIIAQVAMTIVAMIGTYEFSRAVGANKSLNIASTLLSLFVSLAATNVFGKVQQIPAVYYQLVLFLFVIYLFAEVLRNHQTIKFSTVAGVFFAGTVVPYLMMSIIRIFGMDYGIYYVIIPLLAAWGSDSFALFAGMLFGKHKLAPVVSPKKTVEGAIGGVVGAIVCVLVYGFVINNFFAHNISYPFCISVAFFGSILGQMGDLSFSIVKRNYNIKDYGKIFPGHGGVLDRFDSVVFAAPAVEILLKLVA